MRRGPFVILGVLALGALFWHWLIIFAGLLGIVVLASILTGGRK